MTNTKEYWSSEPEELTFTISSMARDIQHFRYTFGQMEKWWIQLYSNPSLTSALQKYLVLPPRGPELDQTLILKSRHSPN